MRHQALKDQISLDDYKRVIDLKNIMGDDKFMLMSGMKTASADDIQALFNIKSQEEISEMLERADAYYEAARYMTDIRDVKTLNLMHETIHFKNEDIQNLMKGDRRPLFKYG